MTIFLDKMTLHQGSEKWINSHKPVKGLCGWLFHQYWLLLHAGGKQCGVEQLDIRNGKYIHAQCKNGNNNNNIQYFYVSFF